MLDFLRRRDRQSAAKAAAAAVATARVAAVKARNAAEAAKRKLEQETDRLLSCSDKKAITKIWEDRQFAQDVWRKARDAAEKASLALSKAEAD